MYSTLLAGCLLLCLIYYHLSRWHRVQTSKNIPGEPTLPLLGNAHLVMRSSNTPTALLQILNRMLDKFQDYGIMKFWFGPLFATMIWEPTYVEIVANSPNTTNKGGLYELFFGDVLNGAFVTNGGQKWKELRKPVTRSVTKKLLENDYMKVFARRSREFVDFLREEKVGKEFNIAHDIARLLLDTFSETHLGIKLNEVRENKWKYVENFDRYLDISIKNVMRYHLFFWRIALGFTKVGEEWRRCIQQIHKFFQWILDERKAAAQDKNEVSDYYPDFLLRRAAEKQMRLVDIRRELGDMVVGGSDTSTTVLSSALLFLAMFPDIQDQVYDEQFTIFGDSSREPTHEDLTDMELLTRVVKETLRLIAPPGVVKTAQEDVPLGKYTIPKGTYIYICIQRCHKDIRFWERPSDFHPDHFLPAQETTRPRQSFLPFGCGPRMCPGYQYGINMIKTIISSIIRNFKISTKMKYEDLVYEYKLLLQVEAGYNLKFEERNKT